MDDYEQEAQHKGTLMAKTPKPRRPKDIPEEREITLPPRDYQPTKAEKEQECDMPGANQATVRRAFFRRVRVKEEAPETD